MLLSDSEAEKGSSELFANVWGKKKKELLNTCVGGEGGRGDW